MKNYYEILEVNNKASMDTIKKVFKMQIKKYHPDVVNGDKKIAENKAKELNEAYSILSDENKRKEYDQLLEEYYIQNEQINEQIYIKQINELKEELNKKNQIIDHFLGGLDLSEYEKTITQEHKIFKENGSNNDDYINNYTNNNNNGLYNKNSNIQAFLPIITRIISIIIALVVFFTVVSMFTHTNVFKIIYDVFFNSK